MIIFRILLASICAVHLCYASEQGEFGPLGLAKDGGYRIDANVVAAEDSSDVSVIFEWKNKTNDVLCIRRSSLPENGESGYFFPMIHVASGRELNYIGAHVDTISDGEPPLYYFVLPQAKWKEEYIISKDFEFLDGSHSYKFEYGFYAHDCDLLEQLDISKSDNFKRLLRRSIYFSTGPITFNYRN